jgi:transposase
MPRRNLSVYVRERIIILILSLLSVARAWKQLIAENIVVDRKTVVNTWNRWLERGTTCYAKPSGRPPHFYKMLKTFIDTRMYENNELTAGEISAMAYRDLNIHVAARSIQRIRRKIGWKPYNVK